MKKTILAIFAMAAVTYGTTSCSKGDDNNATGQDDNSLVITISDGTSPAPSGRGLVEGQVPTSTQGSLVNMEVFLMTASGSVVQEESFTSTELSTKSKTIQNVSSTVSKVVVVANTPSTILSAVRGLTSLDAIAKYPFTAASQNDSAFPLVANKIMMGEGTVTGTGTTKMAGVTIKSLTARFEIGTVTAGTGIEAGSLSLLGVWINNFYPDASMGATLPKTFNEYTNLMWNTSPMYTTSPTTNPFGTVTSAAMTTYPAPYYTPANGSVSTNAGSSVYAFQVFAGPVIGTGAGLGLSGDEIPHVILLIKGAYQDEVTNPDNSKTYYYTDGNKYFLAWITFKNYSTGGGNVTILPNNIYKLGATPAGGGTASGILITADEIGTNPPETPLADLAINVTISPWAINLVTPQVN